jgi:PAP_fibrillin
MNFVVPLPAAYSAQTVCCDSRRHHVRPVYARASLGDVQHRVQVLERQNPNRKALACPLLAGKWELLYTTSDSILGTSRPAFLRPSGPIHQYLGEWFL